MYTAEVQGEERVEDGRGRAMPVALNVRLNWLHMITSWERLCLCCSFVDSMSHGSHAFDAMRQRQKKGTIRGEKENMRKYYRKTHHSAAIVLGFANI